MVLLTQALVMAKKRCCIFTIVRNEKIFLPIWLKYYSKIFDKEDIYVLDHDTNDGSIEECQRHYSFNVIHLHWEYYDDIWKTKMACSKQTELLCSYEYVLYTDADEIVIPDPKKYNDLKDYISKLNEDCILCAAYSLIHIRKEEPPIDLNKSISEQRKYWYQDHEYDKPLLSRIPLEWKYGFHEISNHHCRRDEDLWLLHLHKMDFDISWHKHQAIASMKWNEECVRNRYGWQFRINTIKDFENYFRPKGFQKMGWKYFIEYAAGLLKWKVPVLLKSEHAISWQDWKKYRIALITKIPYRLIERQTL